MVTPVVNQDKGYPQWDQGFMVLTEPIRLTVRLAFMMGLGHFDEQNVAGETKC